MTIFYANNLDTTFGTDTHYHVIFDDPPYNTGKAKSKVPTYDQSESLANQKWTDFNAAWDVIDDYPRFAAAWLERARAQLTDDGSLFICGSHHNIPDVQLALRRLGMYTVQWIAWCIPNSFPQRKMIQMSSSNQVVIWARKHKDHKQFYNAQRAKDWATLDHWRLYKALPEDRTNLRDFWIINNDARSVMAYPFLKGHMAKKPPELVARCLDIALPEFGDFNILDQFLGSGTTGWVVDNLNDWVPRARRSSHFWAGYEKYGEYARMAELRTGAAIMWRDGYNQQLDAAARKEIANVAGVHADYILNGENAHVCEPKIQHRLIVPAQVRNDIRERGGL